MSEQSKAGQYLPLRDWTVNGSDSSTGIWVQGEHGKRVATVINRENDADIAALIAAAPDLLQALQEMVKIWEGPRERAAVGFAAAVVQARAALSKAKGTA